MTAIFISALQQATENLHQRQQFGAGPVNLRLLFQPGQNGSSNCLSYELARDGLPASKKSQKTTTIETTITHKNVWGGQKSSSHNYAVSSFFFLFSIWYNQGNEMNQVNGKKYKQQANWTK